MPDSLYSAGNVGSFQSACNDAAGSVELCIDLGGMD